MTWIAAVLRPAFDRLRRVRSVGKFERIAIDDLVVGEPEQRCGRRDQDELHYCSSGEPECGVPCSAALPRSKPEQNDRRRHRHGQEPSVVARQASRRQTQAALREGLRVPTHGLAEIDDRPDEERQIQRLSHGGGLHVDQIRIGRIHQCRGPRGNSGGAVRFKLAG